MSQIGSIGCGMLQTLALTTFPVAGAPCKFCDSDCRKLLSVALFPDKPSAVNKLLKLCWSASSVGLDELALDPDVLELDAL